MLEGGLLCANKIPQAKNTTKHFIAREFYTFGKITVDDSGLWLAELNCRNQTITRFDLFAQNGTRQGDR